MNKEVLSKYDVMSVAEGAGNSFEDAHNLVAYTRESDGKKMLVLLNFSAKAAQANVGAENSSSVLLLSNYGEAPVVDKAKGVVQLKPYQAAVYRTN